MFECGREKRVNPDNYLGSRACIGCDEKNTSIVISILVERNGTGLAGIPLKFPHEAKGDFHVTIAPPFSARLLQR